MIICREKKEREKEEKRRREKEEREKERLKEERERQKREEERLVIQGWLLEFMRIVSEFVESGRRRQRPAKESHIRRTEAEAEADPRLGLMTRSRSRPGRNR